MPNFEQIKCYEQVRSTDSGVIAIAYAVDILNGSNVYDLVYDQTKTKMREHLIACFQQRKITTFPLYEKRNTEKVVTYKKTSSPWNIPDAQLDYNQNRQKTLQTRLSFQIVLKPEELTYRRKT